MSAVNCPFTEQACNKADSSKETPMKRKLVIVKLQSICTQLEKWALSDHPVIPLRVSLFKAAIYGYSVMLSAMKDDELEIRVKQLEETLKGAVIIPDGTEQKSKRTRR